MRKEAPNTNSPRRTVVSKLGPGIVCLIGWLAMWGEVSAANVASGVVAVAAVLRVSGRLPAPAVHHRVRPVGVVLLLAHFLRLLWLSNWTVVKTTLRPTPATLRAAIVGAPLTQRSPFVSTIVANFISLTPGTLTLDVELDPPDGPPMLYLHVLGFVDTQQVCAEVAQVEAWTLAAVAPVSPSTSEPLSSFDPEAST